MISPRIFTVARCPDCSAALVPEPPGARCTECARQFDGARRYLDLRPLEAFAEQTKYLDEALHVDARHETVAPPSARYSKSFNGDVYRSEMAVAMFGSTNTCAPASAAAT